MFWIGQLLLLALACALALVLPVMMYLGYLSSRARLPHAKRVWSLRVVAGESALLSFACFMASVAQIFRDQRYLLFVLGIVGGLVCLGSLACLGYLLSGRLSG